ncbi:MAG: hypothetical protein PHR83_10450 [Paludibacter sp.]|nr:hypothetical protein [Paludibacter sp.]
MPAKLSRNGLYIKKYPLYNWGKQLYIKKCLLDIKKCPLNFCGTDFTFRNTHFTNAEAARQLEMDTQHFHKSILYERRCFKIYSETPSSVFYNLLD